MNTEEISLTILNRTESIEAGMTGLYDKVDRLETELNNRQDKLETGLNDKMNELKGSLDSKILKLEVDALMELFLVRREIHDRIKSLEKEAGVYSREDDNSVFARQAEESDRILTCLKAIEKIYNELKEKIG